MNMPIFMVIDDENVLLLKARHVYKILGRGTRLLGKGTVPWIPPGGEVGPELRI